MDVGEVGDLGVIMSPTGFVTFKDMASVTCALNTPLTRKTGALVTQIAPDPGMFNYVTKFVYFCIFNVILKLNGATQY